jgi:hypothetical protein
MTNIQILNTTHHEIKIRIEFPGNRSLTLRAASKKHMSIGGGLLQTSEETLSYGANV